MLVLQRKLHEEVVVGSSITVKVIRIAGNHVHLGIIAPPHVRVDRLEVRRRRRRELGPRAALLTGQGKGANHGAGRQAGSHLANKGVSPFLVMKYLGHSSLEIVLKYYHTSEAELLAGIRDVDFDSMLGAAEENEKSSEVPGNPAATVAAGNA